MHLSIAPSDFASIMALPVAVRHDVLEFIGSTPITSSEVGRLLRSLSETAQTRDGSTTPTTN